MHVVEVLRGSRVQRGQGLGRGRRGREAELQTGRGVDAVTVTTVCPPGSRRAMTRTADRPTGDSDSCRKAVRACREAAGSQTCVSSSPGRSSLRPSPVTKPAAGRPRRGPPGAAQQHHPVERAGEGGHRAGGQRQADVPADGGDIVHLERPEQRVAALPGERGGGRVRRVGPAASGRAARGCRSRRSATPSAASVDRRPAEGLQVEQPGDLRLGLGEQPGPAAEPRVTVPPRGIRGGRELGDSVQVHQVSAPSPCGPVPVVIALCCPEDAIPVHAGQVARRRRHFCVNVNVSGSEQGPPS